MKKNLRWILPPFVLMVLFVGATQHTTRCDERVTSTPYNVIVTAFEIEQDAVLRRVQLVESCRVGDVTYHVVEYEGETSLTYMSGIGPESAARTTKQTLESFNVTLLVFSGIAGAVDPNLSVGDTVIVRTWYDYEGGEPVSINSEYLQRVVQENVVMAERGVSVDYFVTDTSALFSNVSIVDMETYYVARAAQSHGVPFIAFRSVSDFADGAENSEGFAIAATKSADAALLFVADN